MELLLIKSAACLVFFIVFYKLVLEQENMHTFKRFYLLGALVLSFSIPFITFTEYVTISATPNILNETGVFKVHLEDQTPLESINYISYILWTVYGLGVVVFGLKFAINLYRIRQRIVQNPKYKTQHITNVLLDGEVTPHTFLNYIFFNKTTFENNSIPQEIKLHEETHAIQKHSLDILFVEFLLIFFWFNPLLYIIKKDIKLNHEFLADAGVLKQGIPPATYQNLLLAFSSGAHYNPLANAINYSLIKKRFTVMKTQTPPQAKWLKSLLLLPLLGGLLFSFSSTKTIEVHDVPPLPNQQTAPISSTQNPQLTINGITCDACQLRLSKQGIEKILLGTTTGDPIVSFNVKFKGKPTERVKGNTLNNQAKMFLNETELGAVIQLFNIKTKTSKPFSPVLITLVDKHDKNYSTSPKVKAGEALVLPPPPPPLSSDQIIGSLEGFSKYMKQTEKNGDDILYKNKKISAKKAIALYKKQGNMDVLVKQFPKGKYSVHLSKTKNSKSTLRSEYYPHVAPPPAPPMPPKVKKGESSHIPPPPRILKGDTLRVIKKLKTNDKDYELEIEEIEHRDSDQKEAHRVKREFEKEVEKHEERRAELRRPKQHSTNRPTMKSTTETIKEMAKNNASFYYNGEAITSKKALELLNTSENINLTMQTNNGISTVHLSDKSMTIINGEYIQDKD